MATATDVPATVTVTTWRTWEMIDGSKPETDPSSAKAGVVAGTYEMELVPNPHGHEAPWYVIKGTLIGMAVGALSQWAPEPGEVPGTDEFHILIVPA